MGSYADAASNRCPRGVTHGKSINMGRIGSGLILTKGLCGVEITKAGLLRNPDVIVIEVPLRPAMMVGNRAQILAKRLARIRQFARHVLVFISGIEFIPARVCMGVAMNFEYAILLHRKDFAPAHCNIITAAGLNPGLALTMFRRLGDVGLP